MDLRVKRTQKMIAEAFIKLVGEKGYEALTIQDIADEAMINRATFYAHFKDKQDLYDQMLDNFIQTFAGVIDDEKVFTKRTLHIKRVEKILTLFYERMKSENYSMFSLFDASSNEVLQKKFSEIFQDKYQNLFKHLRITENDLEVPVDFVIEYMIGIFTSTLRWWMNTHSDMSAEQMAKLVVKLVGNGHLTVLGVDIHR
jgi:AcrR family transcriptional regulator